MSRVFKEHNEYEKNIFVNVMELRAVRPEYSVPPHYANELEINILKDISCDAYIGGQHFSLDGDYVFIIPPNVVHSFYYKERETGIILGLKIDLTQLSSILNIDALLAQYHLTYSDLPIFLSRQDEARNIAAAFRERMDVADTIAALSKLLQLFVKEAMASDGMNAIAASSIDVLLPVISWTEKNFQQAISLDEVAKMSGYSKYHFCKKFKALTGTTYLTYLNYVRISHACKLLKKGYSPNELCIECGFEDAHYFGQIFKKITGSTPRKYIEDCKKSTQNTRGQSNSVWLLPDK